MGKTYIKEKEGCDKYHCCRTTFRNIAAKAGATIHFGRTVRYDVEILDAYVESLRTSEQIN